MKVKNTNVEIDKAVYAPDAKEPSAWYGLPDKVKYCSKCVISNQRPSSAVEFTHTRDSKKQTIRIDDNDVCDACKVAEIKHNKIDWDERENELKELCDKYRRSDGSYDCLVPGSGGKDSFYAAYKLRYKYGMNPLTVTWAPHIYTDWGWKNFQSWIGAGFDNFLHTPNKRVHRLLTRLAIENLFHPFQPFILGQKNLAPKMALLFNIPLVFYGENEAEYGNAIESNDQSKRDWSYFSSEDQSKVFLSGVSIKDLKNKFGLNEIDLVPYMPANGDELVEKNIEVHYLGYYLKWHPQGAYYYSVENGGFQASPERTPGTYSKYNSIDDKIDDLHYYCTYIKFGIGRATYDAAQEIRSGEIDREEGVALVQKFDGEFPERFEKELWEYLSISENEFSKAYKMFEHPGMDKEYFMKIADRFRSPHLWNYKNGGWELRQSKITNI
jgi:N-acetyl sugar amidotransferase